MSAHVHLLEPEALAETQRAAVIEAHVSLGEKGRLVIPAIIREAMEVETGEELELHYENHELRITSRWGRLRQAQDRAQGYMEPGRSIVDELIAERRAEALKESE